MFGCYLSEILSGGAGPASPGKTSFPPCSGQDVTWRQMLYTPLLIAQGAASVAGGVYALLDTKNTVVFFCFCSSLRCFL